MPLFGAIAATAPLPETIARGIMPSRAVLYESGTVTVYYRMDAGQRLLIGGRGPMREIAAISSIPHLPAYASELWPALAGTSVDARVGRTPGDDSRITIRTFMSPPTAC